MHTACVHSHGSSVHRWDWEGDAVPTGGLPLFRAWGVADVGVFVDWSSLYQQRSEPEHLPSLSEHSSYGRYQQPRDEVQAASFVRATANTAMWYAHRLTTVYLLRGQVARREIP